MGSGFFLDEEFSKVENSLLKKLNNGDQVKVVMDGRRGLAYKVV